MAMGLHSSGGRKRRGGRRRAPMADINVTPLVDVMLVLLIVFMVTAPLMTAGVQIDLPESRANPLPQERQEAEIAIDGEGYIFLNGEQVAVGGLPEALGALQAASPSPPPVVLRADKSLDYGRVMAVMGELNRNGFTAISLVTNGSVTPP